MSLVRNAVLAHLQADAGAGGVNTLTGGRIYPDLAPEGASFPLVVVSVRRGATPERVYQGIAYEETRILVKAIAKELTPKNAAAINRRARTRLEDAALTITGYTLLNCEWAGEMPGYPEVVDGQAYRHEGQEFIIWASEN
jgi:hypothetical protein